MTLVVERGATKWLRPSGYEGQPGTARSGADRTVPLPWDKGGRRKHRDRYNNPLPKRKRVNPLELPRLDPLPKAAPREFVPPHPNWWRRPGFGKRLPKRLPLRLPYDPFKFLPNERVLPYIMPLPDGIPRRNPDPIIPPGGFKLVEYCEIPPVEWNGYIRGPKGNCPSNNWCLSGQAIGGNPEGGDMYVTGKGEYIGSFPAFLDRPCNSFWWQYVTGGGIVRHKHWRTYRRLSGAQTEEPPQVVPFLQTLVPAFDPNVMRGLPSLQPALQTALQQATETETETETETLTKAVSFSSTGLKQPVRPVRRAPPRRNSKHKKSMTVAKWLGPLVFGALDTISEFSEIVGAIYDSLPDHIKKQYDQPGRGLTDAAGQYGIDGVDWKAEALWDHWDKIDPEKAVKNILNNVAQDELLGLLHKHLPVNQGQAFEGAFKHINKALETYLFL